jgi:hypothetical protein
LSIRSQKPLNTIINIPVVLELHVSHLVLFYAVFKNGLAEELRVDVVVVRSDELAGDTLYLQSLSNRVPALFREYLEVRIFYKEKLDLPDDSVVCEGVQSWKGVIRVKPTDKLIATLLEK